MAISDWAALGVAGVLLKKGLERAAEEREQNVQEYRQYEEERRQDEAESARQKDVDIKRKNTPCGFKDGIVYQEFTAIAHKVGKRIKRIKKVTVSGAVISCIVESQTGYSDWEFCVDFND